MASRAVPPARVFKTKTFTRLATRAGIDDAELCVAILQVMAGQADDLGGGVYKKRLQKNRYRSIILARGGSLWIYEYLFAKQDRANIDAADLVRFRMLASDYARVTSELIPGFVLRHGWKEICHDL